MRRFEHSAIRIQPGGAAARFARTCCRAQDGDAPSRICAVFAIRHHRLALGAIARKPEDGRTSSSCQVVRRLRRRPELLVPRSCGWRGVGRWARVAMLRFVYTYSEFPLLFSKTRS